MTDFLKFLQIIKTYYLEVIGADWQLLTSLELMIPSYTKYR